MARSKFRAGDRDKAKALFRALPKSVRTATQDALAASAEELTAAIRYNVPIDQGDLRESVRWRRGAPRERKKQGDTAPDKDLAVTVIAGSKKAFYAAMVEFGTRASPGRQGQLYKRQKGATRGLRRVDKRPHAATPAQPFFFPTYRALRKRLTGRIKRAQRRAIREAADE